MLARHVLLLVERQPVGVVQLEGHCAGNGLAVQLLDGVVELALGHQEGGGVAVLLVLHHAGHALHALHQLGIRRTHQVGHEAGELVQHRLLHADQAQVAHGASHDLAQHVAAPFVGWQHAVVDEEGGGTRMVGRDAQGRIHARILAIGRVEQIGRVHQDGMDEVGIVVGELALQNRSDALQAHPGVDGRPRQRRQLAVLIAVELHEYQVPELQETAAAIHRKLFVLAPRLGPLRA